VANPEHIEVVKQGTEAIERWNEENPEIQMDLSSADLSEVDLSYANLSKVDLSNANLCNVDLRGANLSQANLGNVNMLNANLTDANLNHANLSESNLKWVILKSTNLKSTNLTKVDLRDANLIETDLSDADLTNAILDGAKLKGALFCNTKGVKLSPDQEFDNNLMPPRKIGKGHRIILLCFIVFLALIAPGLAVDNSVAMKYKELLSVYEVIIFLAFAILIIGMLTGSVYIASEKGYPGELGFFLVLFLSLFGLIILTLLPDKTRRRPSEG